MTSPMFLRLLPRASVKPSMVELLKDDKCAICLGGFLGGQQVTLLPCSHHYHRGCILAALEVKNFCPLCRYTFPKAEEQPVRIRRRHRWPSSREVFRMWFTPVRFPFTSDSGKLKC